MAETNIYEKLRKVQLELKAPKSQRNNFGNYNYRNVEDILEAAKPILDKHGLTLVISDRIKNIGERYYVEATATLLAYPTGIQENAAIDVDEDNRPWQPRGISVTAFAREEETKKGMDGAQITGAASSYARKYALNGLLAIDDTKDADSDEHRKETLQTIPPVRVKAPTEELATDLQRKQIKAFMTALHVDEADIPAILASDYGVKGKLTKAEAVRVLKEMA